MQDNFNGIYIESTVELIVGNEVIYSYTNNRNPYIDNPQFVSMIWEVTTYSSETEEYIYQTVEVYMVENVYFERRKHFN